MNPVNEPENSGLPENASGGELDSYQFSALNEKERSDQSANLGFILDIPLEVSVELGRTQMLVNDLLKLGQGSVIELSKLAGETLEILANQKLVARGEVVVINEKYGIRVTEIISPMERVEQLR
ncbi:MAG: flagellar motor switch protein FliN [Desulfobacterales bacterium]|nr:flagellar motor switch protein FliN [Desulfobacterales bacterium]